MAERGEDLASTSAVLKQLCTKILGGSEVSFQPYYEFALNSLSGKSFDKTRDELFISEQIKRKLFKSGKVEEVMAFAELYRRLQSQSNLGDRGSILSLLHNLSQLGDSQRTQSSRAASFGIGSLPNHLVSTPMSLQLHQGSRHHSRSTGSSGLSHTLSSISQNTEKSSGISSIRSQHGAVNEFRSQSFAPSGLPTPGASRSALTRYKAVSTEKVEKRPRNSRNSTYDVGDGDGSRSEVDEQQLIKDLLYVMQAIGGRWIKYDKRQEHYVVDAQTSIKKMHRSELLRFAECGVLYNKVKIYIDGHRTDEVFGMVGQSLCAALHQELTEYLRLIAVLDSQLHQENDPGIGHNSSSLTLARLNVCLRNPRYNIKWLAALVDVCKGKKGGALASTVFSYTQHGSQVNKTQFTRILAFIAQPIYQMLMRWMCDGKLEDSCHEFLVASDPSVKSEQLWHSKYSLRKRMIPSFISLEQANRILLTGKSINYLRQVCDDRTQIWGKEKEHRLQLSHASDMLCQDKNSNFQQRLDTIYQVTSRHLIDVLQSKYKFLEHLKAMRRYLLLGQGDFIRHLMDLLEEDLAKPASNLFLHNLSGILETAIRATNAQFDDSDILKRLDVRLLDVSPGDTGWDVFSLEYRVDGPIRTVLTSECKTMYLRVFNFMWRAKRMEYVLGMIWSKQMSCAKELKSIPELQPILHKCYLITSSMMHFIKQVQYYLNFEVLECAWDELLTKVREAKDLDHIIAAHQVFLDSVLGRCLLNEKSRDILQLLRTVFDLIIQFQTVQGLFYEAATHEVNTREAFDRKCNQRAQQGEWEMTDEIQEEERKRRRDYIRMVLPSTGPKLQILMSAYQDTVEQFLHMVASHSDSSLRYLSFRLNFNEHYQLRPAHRSSGDRSLL